MEAARQKYWPDQRSAPIVVSVRGAGGESLPLPGSPEKATPRRDHLRHQLNKINKSKNMKIITIKSPCRKGNHRLASALALSLAGAFLFVTGNTSTADEAKKPTVTGNTPTAEEVKTQKAAATEKADMKVSQDGYNAMRAIHEARMAIFNGEPKGCEKMITKAGQDLAKAAKDESVAKVKEDMIPIDGSLALSDAFVPTEEKAKHIAKANEHLKAGDAKKGLEELKLGEIDVNFSRVLMPLGTTQKRLTDAEGLAKGGKYYECNLALKAAEDAVVLDSVSLLEFPKADGQAATGEKKPAAKAVK
jgi:hypothetical protein